MYKNFNCKAVEVTEVIEKVNSKKSGRKNHRWRRRVKKNIARQVLTYNSKNFYWLNRKLDLERTRSELGKPFLKINRQKIEKTVKIKVKLPHVNKKPLARKRIFVKTLFSHSTLKLERNNFTP